MAKVFGDKKRHSFVEGHEKEFVLTGLFLSFALFAVLACIVYINMSEKAQLEMKFSSEKSFNSIYITLVDNPSKAYMEMRNEGIEAVGIYSSNGRLYQGLGEAPSNLELEKMAQGKKSGSDSTLGVYYYDSQTKMIEYYRLSRMNTAMETGMYFGQTPTFDIPEIVYIRFDGTQYFRQIGRIKIVFFISLVVLCGLFILVVSIYMSNRRYRKALVRNESLAQLGAAARTLTHEIKNPLSALTIQTALMKKTLPAQYTDDMNIIEHEVKRLADLTNRVSEFLKNPEGNPEVINLVPFISGILSLFPEKIDFICDSQEALTVFDRDRARSVFENIIKNAVESTETGNSEVEIEIKHTRKQNICVYVRDRGDGIKPEAINKLFDPFFTTKIHGSGIGLSISKQFVEARRGHLSVYAREGGGTVVEICLSGNIKEAENNENIDS